MSFIRNTSNPEELYIIQTPEDKIRIWAKDLDNSGMTIPASIFFEIMIKYEAESWPGKLEHKGITIVGLGAEHDFKIKLTYNGKNTIMWRVTFFNVLEGILKKSLTQGGKKE